MKILLSPSIIQLSKPNRPPVQIGVYLTYDQLGGPQVARDDLLTELSLLKRSEVIRCVTLISARLTDPRGTDESLQVTLAPELLSAELMDGLRQCLKTHDWNWVIFHRRQMWYLLQAAVVACKEDTEAVGAMEMNMTFGRACLMTNSILHESEPKHSGESWKLDYNSCFVPSVIPILDHLPRTEILARAYLLWFELPKTPGVAREFRNRRAPTFVDAFQAKYGLSLDRLFLIVTSAWSHFQNNAQSPSATLMDSEQYLASSIDKSDVNRALSLLSQTPEALAQGVTEKKLHCLRPMFVLRISDVLVHAQLASVRPTSAQPKQLGANCIAKWLTRREAATLPSGSAATRRGRRPTGRKPHGPIASCRR